MGVCEPLMPDVVSLNEPTYLQIHYNMVGGYTENLEKQQNCQNRGWTLARVWALARDNTVIFWLPCIIYW